MNAHSRLMAIGFLTFGVLGTPAEAAMPVIDIAAVRQLLLQINAWQEQLRDMQLQLTQLQQTRTALTGSRGMEQLLRLTPAARNYLPAELGSLADVLSAGAAGYAELASAARAQLDANVVLSAADLARLPPSLQALLGGEREAVAAAQALSRAAYARSSDRFTALMPLIDRIGATPDAKAIAELEGRIGAEQAMLANEGVKLAALAQVADAERAAHELARRESVLKNHGEFGTRFAPTPPVP